MSHAFATRRAVLLSMAALGWPIAVTMSLEMGVFALAAYFMGWIGAPAVAAKPRSRFPRFKHCRNWPA